MKDNPISHGYVISIFLVIGFLLLFVAGSFAMGQSNNV
jgi:hypothetical protein